MQYSMLLGTQVIGSLINNRYNGTIKVKTQDDVFAIWFSAGSVTSLRSQKNSEQDTLYPLLNVLGGEIEMKPETITTQRIDYARELEKTILEKGTDFKSRAPLLDCIQVSQGNATPSTDLALSDKVKTLSEKAGKGTDLATLKMSLPEKEFWNVFVLASSIGCLAVSYRHHLTNCIVKYHGMLDAEIKKFMGMAISQTFNKKIDQSIIEWKDQFTEPVYGAKPFEAWAKAIQISALEIVPSVIADKMLQKVLSGLTAPEQAIIKTLV